MELCNTVGNYCRSVALSTVLNYYHYPLSEAMCFGLGASFDFSTSEVKFGRFKQYRCISGNNENDFWFISDALELILDTIQPVTGQELKRTLCKLVNEGVPVIVQVAVDKYMMNLKASATNHIDENKKIFRLLGGSAGNHVTVVKNIGNDSILLMEPNIMSPVQIPWKSFETAANPHDCVIRPPANTVYYVRPSVTYENIIKRMPLIISNSIYENMYSYVISGNAWNGIEKLKSLNDFFFEKADEKTMHGNKILFRFFCDVVTGGGFYRRLYSRFLREANDKYLNDNKIREIAKSYNSLGREWSATAKFMLRECPNDILNIEIRNKIKFLEKQEYEAAMKLLERSEALRNEVQ